MKATIILRIEYNGKLYQSGDLIYGLDARVFVGKGWAIEDKAYTALIAQEEKSNMHEDLMW